MGTGNYGHSEGSTVNVDIFDGIELENEDGEEDEDLYQILHDEARTDLRESVMACLSSAWYACDNQWRQDDRDCGVIARNAYHEIWTHEDSYGHCFVTFGVREDVHDVYQFETPPLGLALATYETRAESFFDKLQRDYFRNSVSVATSPWTSTARILPEDRQAAA